MKLNLEPIYGFYHGQDPRTFSPDLECCSPKEVIAHNEACAAAERGARVLKSSFGIGVYYVVMDENGDYVRDATYQDYQREGGWAE